MHNVAEVGRRGASSSAPSFFLFSSPSHSVLVPSFDSSEHPHRRRNALTGDWVLVSPHRAERPWQGQTETPPGDERPKYDPECYLCPGNERAGDAQNPEYPDTFVFTNDFSALKLDTPEGSWNANGQVSEEADAEQAARNGLFTAESEKGICRVICYTPRHDVTLAEMPAEDIRPVVDLWEREYEELGAHEHINYVQIFENKGQMMGCSNPHPHGQIWAQQTVPNEPRKELARQSEHYDWTGRTLLTDYLAAELDKDERVVCQNDSFVALVPFWAVWPYETLVVSRRPVSSVSALRDAERDDLAQLLRRLTTKYDNLFSTSFPYSAGLHQAPTDDRAHPEWHFHMHFYPPLLRSATVKKFMVGYEMLGTPQRDFTPEMSADTLASLSETHYSSAVAEEA
jgi:UDPglucose--hexose-1-phosphate uridylyltransferase